MVSEAPAFVAGTIAGAAATLTACGPVLRQCEQRRRTALAPSVHHLAAALGSLATECDLPCRLMWEVGRLRELAAAIARAVAA
jgi:hypothetical protein